MNKYRISNTDANSNNIPEHLYLQTTFSIFTFIQQLKMCIQNLKSYTCLNMNK